MDILVLIFFMMGPQIVHPSSVGSISSVLQTSSPFEYEIPQLKSMMTNLQTSLVNTQTALNNTQTTLSAKVASLESKLAASQSELTTTKTELSAANLKLNRLESALSNANSTLEANSLEIAALKSRVNRTEKQVAFTACHTLYATLGAQQTVKYNSVTTNIGNAYDPRDGHFEAPVTGLFSFSLTGMAFQTTAISLGVLKNNAEIGAIYTNVGFADSGSITVHTQLSSGDHVWVENRSGAGARLHNGAYNCFSGILDHLE